MTNSANALPSVIEALENELADLERQGNALLTSINMLRVKAGLPLRSGSFSHPANGNAPEKAQTITAIRSDTFVGKRMGSAAREYLEMRKAAGGDAPATVREIFDSLKDGGFDFRSKDDGNAIIVLRAMLRKNSSMFHKLQNGKYGLRSWYGHLKPPKTTAADDDDDDAGEFESKTATDKKSVA